MKTDGKPVKPTPGDKFPGSVTRHGTTSGFTKHFTEGTEACERCVAAKAYYDWKWRSSNVNTQKNRLRARAQSKALSRLRLAHQDEYAVLYREEVAAVFEEAGYPAPSVKEQP